MAKNHVRENIFALSCSIFGIGISAWFISMILHNIQMDSTKVVLIALGILAINILLGVLHHMRCNK